MIVHLHPLPPTRAVSARSHAPRDERRCFFVSNPPPQCAIHLRPALPVYGQPRLRVAGEVELAVCVDHFGQLPSTVVRVGRRWHTPAGVRARKCDAIADVLMTDCEIDADLADRYAAQGWVPAARRPQDVPDYVPLCVLGAHDPHWRWCEWCVQLWRLVGRQLRWCR